jgi:hypothetical protein
VNAVPVNAGDAIESPWKVPPENAAPVNPVEAVIVVPLMVVPWKVPPEKALPVNPVDAVTVEPWKVPPVKEGEATVAP